MTLTQDDLKWIATSIRQEFDMPKEAWLKDSLDKELIERAKRFCLYDLAAEMEADLKFQRTTVKEHL